MKNENLNEPNFNLTNDVLFKDYYSNPDNLSVLLSLILGIKILPNEIIYENNEELIENKYRIIFIDLKKLEYCDNIEIKEYLSMIKSNDNIKRNLYSNNIFIKEAAVNMNNYTELSKTIDLALEELRQRLDYNTSRNEAKEEGIEEGIQKKQKEVVLNLNKMGMEIELIAKAVNLSVDEVKKILNM